MEPRSADTGERIYHFGDFRLLPGRQLLLRGDRPIRVGSRALELLRLLVERPGQLLSKAELISFAWPDTFVHEDNLKVNIAALRRALGDTSAELPYIATVPGRGYRFVATVQVEQLLRGDAPPTTLPQEVAGLPRASGIVGREDDIARIADELASRRFLTVVGPAGVGKTTVALAAARVAAQHFPDGVCFVDFGTIGDPQLVPAALATAIGAGGSLKDMLVGIIEALRGQRRILILDNCEHVVRSASMVAEHIRAALPDIAILGTSREPLRSRAETIHRLAPLCCPPPDKAIDRETAMAFAAVELFVARAREAVGFEMTDAHAPVVAEVCRRLDGIPLAIELAAPRLRSWDAATLLRLLDSRFDLLSYGPPDAPLRQQTLLATLDWSYRLLSEDEAATLRLLSVFAGTFTLEDAIGVCRDLAVNAEQVASCMESLAGKSLLSTRIADGTPRYRLLDATRAYAAERLHAADEQRRAHTAHAAYLLRLFERAETEWHWRVREDWTAAYGRHVNDLRKALDWSFGEDGDAGLGVRLTAYAIALWDELSSVGESGRYVRRALQSPRLDEAEPSVRMKLTTAQAWSMSYTERFEPGGEAAWLESLRLAEATGDHDYQLRALWGLSVLHCFHGRHREVLACLKRFEAIAEDHDRSAAPAGERLRVITEFYLGDVGGAHGKLKQLARHYDSITKRSRMARFQIDWYVGIRTSLSFVEWVAGRPREALATAEAALDGATAIGHVVSQANALVLTVIPVLLWSGQIDAAERQLAALVANLNQRNIAIWTPAVRFFEGMIRQERGDPGGIEQMREVLDELISAGFLIRMPNSLSMLADAALRHGQPDLARQSITTAMDLVERNEERWCQPEVLRVRGLVQLRDGNAVGGELSLIRAAKFANESGALSFELRAALTLAGSWADKGRVEDALAFLEPVLSRFDAGGDSRDVVQARRLMQRLRSMPGQ